jgi:hypothetical protein
MIDGKKMSPWQVRPNIALPITLDWPHDIQQKSVRDVTSMPQFSYYQSESSATTAANYLTWPSLNHRYSAFTTYQIPVNMMSTSRP